MIHLICPNPAIDRTLLVKNFRPEIPNRPYELKEFAGGKSFNVAYALSFAKPQVDFTIHTIIGGRNGDYLLELAEKNQMPVQPTKIDVNTRVCNIIMDTESATTYPIYENSFNLNADLLARFTASLEAAIQPGDTLVFSGSLMKGMPQDYIANFITKFAKKNVKVFVDTSGAALLEAHAVKPYAIKINDEEVLDLAPASSLKTIDDFKELLLSDVTKDIPIFIVTLGAKGVIAKINQEIYLVTAKKVAVKNPIASGDFFLGGLVKGDSQQLPAEEMLKLAISYSTANVLNWYPELKETDIQEVYQNLTVEKLV